MTVKEIRRASVLMPTPQATLAGVENTVCTYWAGGQREKLHLYLGRGRPFPSGVRPFFPEGSCVTSILEGMGVIY